MVLALRRLAPFALPISAVLFFLSGPVIGATPDEEEYRNAILTVVLHARAVLEGQYPYWTSALGFGLPHPLHPAFLLHPLMPLFGLMAPDAAARVLYTAHAILGAAGCWWLVRRLGPGPWIAGLAACTWALAAPSQNYALTDFWPTEFMAWSLAPLLLLCALRVLDAPRRAQPWRDALAFGLVAGLMTANGHAGHVPVFFVALAVMFVVDWRRTRHVVPALVLASVVGAAIAAPTLTHLLSEAGRFPPLPRLTVDRSIGGQELVDMVLRPVSFVISTDILPASAASGARGPFFGGPMLLLALAYVTTLAGVAPRLSLVLPFATTFVLMMATGLNRLEAVSSMSAFRDPMTLYGIVLGSMALHSVARRHPRLAIGAGALQLTVLFLAAWPLVSGAWRTSEVERAVLRDTTTTAALRGWVNRLPGRWYVAPALEGTIREGRLFNDGLWTDVWVYRGLPVVNGTFKGVSADPMYPSGTLPLGRIQGHRSTVTSASTLDVLGVGAVLATATEPVAPTLQEVARLQTSGGEVRLLRNPQAWPGAALIDARVSTVALMPLAGCDAPGVLCLDFAPVSALNHDTSVQLTRAHGVLRASFRADPATVRWLVVAEMHRRQWTAWAGSAALPVTRVLDGLIGVEVPAGIDTVELRYRPMLLIGLTWVSITTLLLAVTVLLAGLLNRVQPRTTQH